MTQAFSTPGGAVRLADWGVIRAHGEDAARFLHSQLTQDVETLGSTQARPAGYCSAKGRLLGSFVLWRPAEDEVLLACSADLLEGLVRRLSMFVLRSKVRLSDAGAQWAVHGLAGDAVTPAAAWQVQVDGTGAASIRLPDALGLRRALCLVPTGAPAPALPELPELPAEDWAWLEVHAGHARIVAATVDRFVPQMLNYEVLGAVDFRKGCYPGQEVVARSQYRGIVKRRAQLFHGTEEARPGDEIYDAQDPGQPAGLVANAAWRGGAAALLVEVKLAALEGGARLHLKAPDGPPLQRVELPYPLPLDAA